jgi:DNA end-binding protein Ku
MARVVWKGAIVFGLVHIPVDLYPGARNNDLDLDWIDKRDMAPVGYQRINKVTGKVIANDQIVKGYQYEKGDYVVLSDEDFRLANPKATQSVEILAFVPQGAIPPPFFETPYRLVPGKRGEKGYVLLREALKKSGRIGVAQVVIRARQHLAAVMPFGNLLLMETLRYAEEILDESEFDLPASTKAAGVTDKEMQLAIRLVEDMSEDWKPEQYRDTYRDDLMKRIREKVKSGETETLTAAAKGAAKGDTAQVIDLMAALKRSIDNRDGAGGKRASSRAAAAKPARRSSAARKAPAARKRA